GRMTRPVLDGGTAEPVSDLVELAQVRVREVGVTLAEVLDRLLHPVALILLRRLENATTVDVAEQLVSRSIQKLLFGQVLPPSVLPCPPDPILARFGPQPSNVTVQAGETKSRRGRELDGSRYPFSGPGSRSSRASARRREGRDCHDPHTTRRAERTRARPVLHAPATLRHLRSRARDARGEARPPRRLPRPRRAGLPGEPGAPRARARARVGPRGRGTIPVPRGPRGRGRERLAHGGGRDRGARARAGRSPRPEPAPHADGGRRLPAGRAVRVPGEGEGPHVRGPRPLPDGGGRGGARGLPLSDAPVRAAVRARR